MQPAEPLNPQRAVWELSERLPDGCIVTADSGTSTVWYARDLRFRRGMAGSVSGSLATMGCAVPYAIAAKLAYPGRPVVALVGDGAMQMNGMTELITLARLWREWADPRLIVMVLNNQDLAYVTWEQRVQAGDPKFESAQRLPDGLECRRRSSDLGAVHVRQCLGQHRAPSGPQAFITMASRYDRMVASGRS